MRRLAVGPIALALFGLALFTCNASANHAAIEQISVGPAGGNGPHNAVFRHATPDGVRVLFTTPEQLVSADTDAQPDIYERAQRSHDADHSGNGYDAQLSRRVG